MTPEIVLQRITEDGIVAGMRGDFPPEKAVTAAEACLHGGGFRVFELTLNSPDPIPAMQAVKRMGGDAVCAGMGTVLTPDDARRAIDAGADFLVTPSFHPGVVAVALDAGVFIAPGVLTPTEIADAWALGVPLLKLFPVGALGIDYFRAIRGPFDAVRFMVNGAIDDANAAEFLKAGAIACGILAPLTGKGSLSRDEIARRAAHLRMVVDRARGIAQQWA